MDHTFMLCLKALAVSICPCERVKQKEHNWDTEIYSIVTLCQEVPEQELLLGLNNSQIGDSLVPALAG